VPFENNSIVGYVKPIDDDTTFRGEQVTSQSIFLIPATFDNNIKIVRGQGFRVQFDDTSEGAIAESGEFFDMKNEMGFEMKFSTGITQLEMIIDPDINFLDAICDLGGLFGAVTAGIAIAMQLMEKQAYKHRTKINKIKMNYRNLVNNFRRKIGLPAKEEVVPTNDDAPGEVHHHHHHHHHHGGHDRQRQQKQTMGRMMGRKRGLKGMMRRQAIKKVQERANKGGGHHEHHHKHHGHHHKHHDQKERQSQGPEFYKHGG
jgi:hypothetical protein